MLPLCRRRRGSGPARPPDWTRAFGRPGPLEVDLGCGRGHYALRRAEAAPEIGFVAIDTRAKWIARIRRQAARAGLTNLRAIRCDARWDLPLLFGPGSVAGFSLHHPDPWWKKRHRKRRLVQSDWLGQLVDMLQVEGWLFVQTDVPELAEEIAATLAQERRLVPVDPQGLLSERLGGVQSHRGQRCAELGIPVRSLAYRRLAPEAAER